LLCVFLFFAGYFLFWNVFPFIDSLFGPYTPNIYSTRFWPAVSLGLIDPLKVVASAAIIKYVKYWLIKQKESEKLEREKINAELQLLKAQIHPNFLFTSLKNIYDYSLVASTHAPEMLLKLSDLLSYMLYECDRPLVPLAKEIKMMKDYVALEKIRMNGAIDMELNVKGDMNGKMIAPLLLLPFFENSFKQSNNHTEQAWINLDIDLEGETFCMKLTNGTTPGNNGLETFSGNGLDNVQKRLFLMYPQRHELKINREPEMLIVLLKIHLTETAFTQAEENEETLNKEPANLQLNQYAEQK